MKFEVLISEQEINKKIDELANKIMGDYQDEEITILCVLKGASFFTVDLCKRIKNILEFEFIQVSSYGNNTKTSGTVTLKKDVDKDIKGKNILIIEDIIDSGITMNYLLELLKERNPKSIKVCSLLNKPSRREIDVNIDYIGFDIPNKYVFGYGLDYEENYRNLPYIANLIIQE